MKLEKLHSFLSSTEKQKTVTEARGDVDGQELLSNWQDNNKAHNFEGISGVRNLEKLITVLGYHGINDFLGDNPGAIEAIVEFIGQWIDRNEDWAEALSPETEVDIGEVVNSLKNLGVSTTKHVVRAFIEGGGPAPRAEFDKFIKEIEELGYDSAATTWKENEKFWTNIGITSAMFDVMLDNL